MKKVNRIYLALAIAVGLVTLITVTSSKANDIPPTSTLLEITLTDGSMITSNTVGARITSPDGSSWARSDIAGGRWYLEASCNPSTAQESLASDSWTGYTQYTVDVEYDLFADAFGSSGLFQVFGNEGLLFSGVVGSTTQFWDAVVTLSSPADTLSFIAFTSYGATDSASIKVSAVPAVPEPGTFVLLGSLLGVAGVLRRKLNR